MEQEPELGNIGSSGCPCGEVETKDYLIEAHCWRTYRNCECPFAGVHYSWKKGKKSLAMMHAREIRNYIKESYLCEVALLAKGLIK